MKPASIFRSEALSAQTFTCLRGYRKQDLLGALVAAKSHAECDIDGDIEDWPVNSRNELFSTRIMNCPIEQWKNALGSLWCRIAARHGSVEQFQPAVFGPLLAHSWHGDRKVGGSKTRCNIRVCSNYRIGRVAICYLIGLDWTIPGHFQELRGQEKVAKELRRAARSGELGRYFGKAAELRTQLTLAEAHTDRLPEQLDAFRVVPEYKERWSARQAILAERSTI